MSNLHEVSGMAAFAGLDEAALEDCAKLALRRTLAAGRHVFSQGEPGARFHSLVSGYVRISQSGADGANALLRFVGPGQPYGSFAMFIDGCYPAEAVAIVESIELSWSEAQFRSLIDRHPKIAINLLHLAARRLGELQDRLREMAAQTAEQRIATALLRLAEGNKCTPKFGDLLELAWPLSRKDIAAVSMTTIYTASRVIAAWQRDGLLTSVNGRIRLLSPRSLAAIADHT